MSATETPTKPGINLIHCADVAAALEREYGPPCERGSEMPIEFEAAHVIQSLLRLVGHGSGGGARILDTKGRWEPVRADDPYNGHIVGWRLVFTGTSQEAVLNGLLRTPEPVVLNDVIRREALGYWRGYIEDSYEAIPKEPDGTPTDLTYSAMLQILEDCVERGLAAGHSRTPCAPAEKSPRERKPHRPFCHLCNEVVRVDFSVTDEVWELATHESFRRTYLCLKCFTRNADERGVDWSGAITFRPISQIDQAEIVRRAASSGGEG